MNKNVIVNITFFCPAQLVSLIKELHRNITEMESTKYDTEIKIRRQDYEVF